VTGPGRGGAAGRARCRRTEPWARPARAPDCARGAWAGGVLAQPPYCSPCHQWRSKKYHQPGACRRCGRAWLVNADGLCPPCITEIQQSDAAWYFSPALEPRPVQLAFILPGLRLPHRMPFGSYRARSDGRFRPPPWARAQLPAEVLDDPRFCPSAPTGQLPLFEARRTLVVAGARGIRDRVLAGWDQAEPVMAAYAAGHEYGQWWQLTMSAVLRPALAVHEADGKPFVDDAVLDVLPGFAGAAAEILRRAGLLDPDAAGFRGRAESGTGSVRGRAAARPAGRGAPAAGARHARRGRHQAATSPARASAAASLMSRCAADAAGRASSTSASTGRPPPASPGCSYGSLFPARACREDQPGGRGSASRRPRLRSLRTASTRPS
jgi:hypothetical protein